MTDNGTAPKGYIKIARKAFATHRWWLEQREYSRFEAWLDVIQLASFRGGAYRTDLGVVELARGEFVASLRWLADRWLWSVKRVRVWLQSAQNAAMLRAQRETHSGTVYVIVNYDTYQSGGQQKGTPEVIDEGTAGAQQGHKIEAGKASKSIKPTALSDSPEVNRVLAHYKAAHPRRRPGESEAKVVARALALGYSTDELLEAIDGNAKDPWHIRKKKHELSYVLRNGEKIDDFRDRAAAQHEMAPLVDEATGMLTAAGMAVMRGDDS